ncbi:MAG: hypothetical protein U0R24_05835 [Solirubrobacterales bacterium]
MKHTKVGNAEFIARRPPTFEELQGWIGWRATDLNGGMIGHVESIQRDESGSPRWVVVSEFRLGDGRRFMIPVDDAVGGGGHVWSPYPREHIHKTARITGPRVTVQAQRRLRAHYEIGPRAA